MFNTQTPIRRPGVVPQRTALVVALMGAFSSTAIAQPTTNTLKPVVITATRSALEVSDAPAAVSVVTSQEIGSRNVSRISDALQKVPGLYLGRGENGQSNSSEGGFSLRGMSTNRTLVLLDGLQPLQNANSQGVNWLTVFVDDVERVEVVPGAFASLYGSNAMGGVVNVISKRPTQQFQTVFHCVVITNIHALHNSIAQYKCTLR